MKIIITVALVSSSLVSAAFSRELHKLNEETLKINGFLKSEKTKFGVQREFASKDDLVSFFRNYKITYDEIAYEQRAKTLFSKRKTVKIGKYWFGIEETYVGLADGGPNEDKKVKYLVTAILLEK